MNLQFRQIRVLHNEQLDAAGRHEAWVRGYRPEDSMVEILAFPIAGAADMPEAHLVEQLYDALNYQPAEHLLWLTDLLTAVKGRSLSVGDALVVDDTTHVVERMGWSKVDLPTNITAAVATA